ncbi:hypothetical protein Moror_679 [Moniliophthora roreri MCA 2997]|uniref:Uncharacterized protein n=1 Tax=Moniliophthora roreri (strain MCA 2997) TaxID=1381753 RepID=V2WNW8_MONRO|nr:hypothetical protein Moror_679 [Moniliophthora roreri MCA 2997]
MFITFTVNYNDVLILKWKPKDESSFKHLTVNLYLAIQSATPPPDTFNNFKNVFDEVQPSNPKMDNVNSKNAESYRPNAIDHLTLYQKLQVDAASHINNENEEEDDIKGILEKLREEKSSSKPPGPELHAPIMVNLTEPAKPVWSDVAHTSH